MHAQTAGKSGPHLLYGNQMSPTTSFGAGRAVASCLEEIWSVLIGRMSLVEGVFMRLSGMGCCKWMEGDEQ